MRVDLGTWLVAAATMMGLGCTPADRAKPPTDDVGGVCTAIGPLKDLHFALAGGTATTTNDGVLALARADEELAYLAAARSALASMPSPLDERLAELERVLAERRDAVERATTALRASHAAATVALHEAALCGTIDLRDLGRSPEEVEAAGPGADPVPPNDSPAEAKARLQRTEKHRQALRKAPCDAAQRLWAAVQEVDLESEVSSRAVASHVRELTFEGERGAVRDGVSETLSTHADNLATLQRYLDYSHQTPDPLMRRVNQRERAVLESLTRTNVECLRNLPAPARGSNKPSPPRDATVVVRPKWAGAVASIAENTGGFGSGFVVRTSTPGGGVATWIVTNRHVLGGASTAEIMPGSETEKPRSGSTGAPKPDPVTATLVRALPYDDIAILRVDDSPRGRALTAHAIEFRTTPAKEREKVLAAGFPGLGGTPSYQVSAGIVSNAKFDATENDPEGLAGYVQHTAEIDPGNSGGPLIDDRGKLLGMNTLKVVDRTNVGLAIPTARIQLALMLANERPRLNLVHARAACNMLLGVLASDAPPLVDLDRFSVAFYEAVQDRYQSSGAARHRQRVQGVAESALEVARLRAYSAVRQTLAAERGIPPYEACTDVAAEGEGFVGSFRTRAGAQHRMQLVEEDGMLRLRALDPS